MSSLPPIEIYICRECSLAWAENPDNSVPGTGVAVLQSQVQIHRRETGHKIFRVRDKVTNPGPGPPIGGWDQVQRKVLNAIVDPDGGGDWPP